VMVSRRERMVMRACLSQRRGPEPTPAVAKHALLARQ
jgi:hypothetical protein